MSAGRGAPLPGVAPFDGIGLTLVGQRHMLAGIVGHVGVSGQLVGVVLAGGGRDVEERLQPPWLVIKGHVVGDNAAAGAIYLRDEVDPLLFCPSKV